MEIGRCIDLKGVAMPLIGDVPLKKRGICNQKPYINS